MAFSGAEIKEAPVELHSELGGCLVFWNEYGNLISDYSSWEKMLFCPKPDWHTVDKTKIIGE